MLTNPTDETRTVDLIGVSITPTTEQDLIRAILSSLDRGEGGWVVTANLDIVRQSVHDRDIASMVDRSTITVADGMPLVWASKVSGQALPERVAGSSLILTLSEAAAGSGRTIFLIGGDEGVAEEAGKVMTDRFAGLSIAGHYCPPFGFDKDDEQVDAIANRLREAQPDIVFVALGFPKQERLVERIRDACPDAWWLGVGISFSFVAGRVTRAPRWIQKLGLEWVHRMVQEPRRLFKRYVLHDIPFAMRLGLWAVRRRLRGRGAQQKPEE